MLLNQIYHGASGAFADDPELRELLRSTFEKAEDGAQPALMQDAMTAAQPRTAIQDVPKSLPAPTGTVGGPARPGGVTAGQVTPRSDMGVRVLGSEPVDPNYLATLDQTFNAVGPIGTGEPRAPIPGGVPPGVRPVTPQRPASYPDASVGNSVSAFLQGLGTSDAILPAIGGGMQAVENLGRSNKARNQTLRALINRGLDEETALAAVNNPDLMKVILPRLFGGKMKLGKITTTQGDQSVFYDEYGNIQPIGAPGGKGGVNSKFRQKMQENDAALIKDYRTAADDARTSLSNLSQLEEARKGVSYEGAPLADLWSRVMGYVANEGAGENVRSLSTNIQLGFTNMTKGAITDREMGIFAGATPGLQMSDDGANRVIQGMRAGARRTIERAKFFEEYARRTGGSLDGALERWNSFIDQNPVLSSDPKAPGRMSVNEANVGSWQRYLPRMPSEVAPNTGPVTLTPASSGTFSASSDGPSPSDFGEDVEGMTQLPDGRWVVPDPNDPSRYLVWEPPS